MSDAAGSDEAGGTARGPIAYFTGNRVAGNLLMVLLLAGGFYTASRLEVTLLPQMQPVKIAVTVPYPGASPAEVVEDVNRRVEEKLIALDGIERVTSYATASLGEVVANVGVFANPQVVLDDVRSAVRRIKQFPPPDAERPEIRALGQAENVMTVAVASSTLSDMDLRRAVNRVADDLLALPGVTLVRPYAVPDAEISIEASEEALRRHGLTMEQLARQVRAASLNMSAGEVRTDAGELVVRTRSKRVRAEEFEDIVVLSQSGGSILRLGDLATVEEGVAEERVSVRIEGRPAILVGIDASDGQQSLDITQEVRELLAGYEAPRGTEVFVWDDKTEYVWSRVGNLLATGFLGFALVFILLSLVFDFRIAFWTAVGVPTSFLGALLLFPAFDLTLNFAAVFAMVIMIGVVVDDAVVVGESIADQRERGVRGPAGALAGARAVRAPVVLGCVTTGLAFTPLLFLDGPEGQYLRVVPIVVAAVLIVSLAEAFLVLPSHLSRSGTWSRWPLTKIQARSRRNIAGWRDRFVAPAIAAAVRRPYVTLLASVGGVALVGILLATNVVKSDYNVGLTFSRIQVDLEFAPGTPFAVTQAAAERVAQAAREASEWSGDDPFTSLAVVVGENLGIELLLGADGAGRGAHLASVVAQVVPETRRSMSLDDLERLWMAHVGDVPGALAVRAISGPLRAGRIYALAHPDADQLAGAVAELRRALAAHDGVDQVEDTLTPGKLQYDVDVTEAGEAAGLSARMVASQLRARFHGIEVQRIQNGRQETKVMVRYPPDQRRSLRELRDERVGIGTELQLPLHTAARIAETREPATMMRIDGIPAAEVAARVDFSQTSGPDFDDAMEPVFDELMRGYPELRLLPLGAEESWARIVASATYTVPITLLVIYALIAVSYRSYWQPFVILAGVPFAFAGAVVGHAILDYAVAPMSLFGMVAVAGVAVNDTLVLMHRFNRIEAQSPMPVVAAVSAAARQRFRPIALTTATTVVGTLPLLLVKSEATMIYAPLVVSLVFGLIAASVGVLFVVPTLLYIAETARERRISRRGSPQRA